MGVLKDLTGQRFGHLVAKEYVRDGKKHGWRCVCDCGKETIVETHKLTTGHTKSCGCQRGGKGILDNPLTGKRFGRLLVTEHLGYYVEWAYANGYDENAPMNKHTCTIDRINPYGNYDPSNCRWADAYTQAQNKRKNWKGDTDVRINNVN